VVARELARLARERARSVRQEQFRLADGAGIDEEFARRRIARGVLRPDADVVLAERDPVATLQIRRK